MALIHLFDMVKADRYTADGREAIIKAQEAETEDATRRTYQIGEISQSTGLQKTANGWVKPKSGKQPEAKKENPTRTFEFKSGPDGMPKPGTGKQVQTFKTKEEAQKTLNTQNAVAKYKDLPGPQKKDALFASTFEGISIGQTQNQMERQGWDLIEADDQVNVYGKPDGSKVTMKHDGKNITETIYEAPAAGSESKPGRDRPALKKEDHIKLAKEVLSNTSATDPGWTAEEIAKEWKLGKADAEEVKKEFDNLRKGSSGNKPAAEKTDGFDYRSSMEKEPRSAASFKGAVSHSIPMNQTDRDELEGLSKFMSEEKATYQNALKNRAQALVDGHKGNGDWFPEKEKAIMKIAKAVGFDDELHKFIAEENRGYDLGYSEDAAPRVLTGDTRIRVRKA